jgi:dihydrofolate reductase
MRKLILSMNLTLDGFMAGPDCELDWHFERWTSEMAESLCEELSKADTILLGRVTYSAMARYWPQKAKDLSFQRDDLAFASMMNNYAKVVFSRTLVSATWNNSRLVKKDVMKEILSMKLQPGKNMIIYGSGRLASLLMRNGLIDEYRLWIHPVVLGKGKPLFKDLTGKLHLKLMEARTFGSGVIVLYYKTEDEMVHESSIKKAVENSTASYGG